MGQKPTSFPEELIPILVPLLSSTQVRAVLHVGRLERKAVNAVYTRLATCCNRTSRKALKTRVARDAFWLGQRLQCELCFARKSCVRVPCNACRETQNSLPLTGIDICCQCFQFCGPHVEVDAEMAKIRSAANAWKTTGSLDDSWRLSLTDAIDKELNDLGFDCAGMIFQRRRFKRGSSKFWDNIRGARNEYLDKFKQGFTVASLKDLEIPGSDDDNMDISDLVRNAMPEAATGPIIPWGWHVVHDMLESWEQMPLGDENAFFQAEEEILEVVRRIVRLLNKVRRLGATTLREAAAAASKRVAEDPTPTECLNTLAVLLIGEAISADKDQVELSRRPLWQAMGYEIRCRKGLPALYRCEVAAEQLAQKILEKKQPRLSYLAQVVEARGKRGKLRAHRKQRGKGNSVPIGQPPAKQKTTIKNRTAEIGGDYSGLSYAEIWCGEPAGFLGFTNKSKRKDYFLESLYDVLDEIDPNRGEEVARMNAEFARPSTIAKKRQRLSRKTDFRDEQICDDETEAAANSAAERKTRKPDSLGMAMLQTRTEPTN